MREMSDRAMAHALRRKCVVYLLPKVANRLKVEIVQDDSFIAYTDGSAITLGTFFGKEFQKASPSERTRRKFIFYAGICAHELAHLLYTQFALKRKVMQNPRKFLKEQSFEQESLQNLTIPAYLGWVAQLQNIFEDSFIEWRFKEDWGGGYLSNCMIWTRYFVYNHDCLDENQIAHFPPYNTIHNFLLDFCIFQRENYSFLTDEQKGWIKGALQILQPVLHKTIRQNGKESFLTAFKLANYILSLYPVKPSDQQMQAASQSSRDYSKESSGSESFQQDAQQQSKQKSSGKDPNLSKQLQKAMQQLEQSNDRDGETQADEQDASSATDSDEPKAFLESSNADSGDSDDNTNDKPDANADGDTDAPSPGEADMNALLAQLESGLDEDLNKATSELIQQDFNQGVWEKDLGECLLQDRSNSAQHLAIKQEVQPVAKILARSYLAKFRKAQAPSVRCYDKGKFRPKFAVQTDMMYFDGRTVKNAPTKIALQLLLDGSGSMSGNREFDVTKVAILLAEFCKEVGIPISVYWHSCYFGATSINIFQQKSFNDTSIEGITVHNSQGCNRDGQAIRFATKNLATRPEQHKILLLLSDGQPSAYDSLEEAREDIAFSLNFCKRKKINFIAGAFADDKDALKKLYGEKYLDIPSIEQFGPHFINRLKKLIK